MLDLGAMSTAPYKETRISPEEEIRRLEAAVAVVRQASGLPVSVDTPRAEAAAAALAAGATVVNAVAGFEVAQDHPHQERRLARTRGADDVDVAHARVLGEPDGENLAAVEVLSDGKAALLERLGRSLGAQDSPHERGHGHVLGGRMDKAEEFSGGEQHP